MQIVYTCVVGVFMSAQLFPVRMVTVLMSLIAFRLMVPVLVTAVVRSREKRYVSPEDNKLFNSWLSGMEEKKYDDVSPVDRIQYVHRNDVENGLLLMFPALLYIVVANQQTTSFFFDICALGLPIVYLLSRTVYIFAYMLAVQPLRSISYGVGTLILLLIWAWVFWSLLL